MSYKLIKPYTEEQKLDFIVKYNHDLGLNIEEGIDALYALEEWEILIDGLPYRDRDYEHKKEQMENERIALLSLTKADVERGIYKSKGMDFEDILILLKKMEEEGSLGKLDIKELKIELHANNFYRGNPYVGMIGEILGFTVYQLDKFFETNDYHYLLPEGKV